MSNPMTADEQQAIVRLSAEERFDYFLAQAEATDCVWTLRGDDGGVLMSADGKECMPVWPSEAFAATWAVDDWADCAPFAIELEAWMQRWLPGMQADGLSVVVFPDDAEEGLVLRPKELKNAMQDARQR